MKMSDSRSGFTLIELMVVVIVLAALAGMVVPRLVDRPDKMKAKIVLSDIRHIDTQLKIYRLDNGEYPNALGSIEGEFDVKLEDPWDRQYYYKYPGSKGRAPYDIYSAGPDGEEGSSDDIGNWQL